MSNPRRFILSEKCKRDDCTNYAHWRIDGVFVCEQHGIETVRLAKVLRKGLVIETLDLEEAIPDTERAS